MYCIPTKNCSYIKLDGEIADHYIIYYSAYISNIGWTDWAKNDDIFAVGCFIVI